MPGKCRPGPLPTTRELHGLPGPQDASLQQVNPLQQVTRQEESHVLGQCHQVSGVTRIVGEDNDQAPAELGDSGQGRSGLWEPQFSSRLTVGA
jgi:hypothetical protein